MQLFVYEFVTGGGFYSKPDWGTPSSSLTREGHAMMRAIVDDISKIENVDVKLLWDAANDRPPPINAAVTLVANSGSELHEYNRLAAECDYTLLIAPEFDDELSNRVQRVLDLGGKPIGPSVEFTKLASDKWLTFRTLVNAGVPTPRTELLTEQSMGDRTLTDQSIDFPRIVKPRFGAGSMDVHLLRTAADAELLLSDHDAHLIVQAYCPGRSASVAAIGNRSQVLILAPFWQNLSTDDRFAYLGGTRIGDQSLADRAKRLAQRALDAMPKMSGYVGIDVILGDASDGRDDFVIEINPRLTTSYLGLRAIARQNLAKELLNNQLGGMIDGSTMKIEFSPQSCEFTPDGDGVEDIRL